MQKRWYVLIALLSFLSACTQTGKYGVYSSRAPAIEFSQWYIRGVFNWWEAQSAYQLQQSDDTWFVDVELFSDQQTQTYDFKFSNVNWETDQTCGANAGDYNVSTQKPFKLSCGESIHNLQFTPSQTGIYRFSISGKNNNNLILTVSNLSTY